MGHFKKVHGRTLINYLVGQGVNIASDFDYRSLPLDLKVTIAKVYLELADNRTLFECLPGESELGGLLAPFLDSAISYAELIKSKIRSLPNWNTQDDIAERLSCEAVFRPEFEKEFRCSMKHMVNVDPIRFHVIVGEKIANYLEKMIEAEIEEALAAYLNRIDELFSSIFSPFEFDKAV